MATEDIERLRYYAQQYLGPGDFQDEQAYHRGMRRRHNVGHHTWGIVAGLELEERQPSSGPLELWLNPGMAVDGFGRELLVLRPRRLDKELFAGLTADDHYEVWIRYQERSGRPPSNGYQSCEELEHQLSRLVETYQLFAGPDEHPQDPVMVDGKEVTSPPDLSVPHQELGEGKWLVPLGRVHWNGPADTFEQADAGALEEGRRYIGVVAAVLLAPGSALTVRDRDTDSPLAAAAGGVAAVIEGSLTVDRLLTAHRDVQIHGGSLELRDSSGGGGAISLSREEQAGRPRLIVRAGTDTRLAVDRDAVTVLDGADLSVDGGRVELGAKGQPPDWALKVEQEALRFLEADANDRVAFEVLEARQPSDPAIRLGGEPAATFSPEQLIDLTDGGLTTLHRHAGLHAIGVNLSTSGATDADLMKVELPERTSVVASVHMSSGAADPASAVDILSVDGADPPEPGAPVFMGEAKEVVFRLRAPDETGTTSAVGVLLYEGSA
jgi:hypothetical protein